MKGKHGKTLSALLARPTLTTIRFADIETLIVALGGKVTEGAGSRVAFHLGNAVLHAHRPHPGKDAKRYQVEAITRWLEHQGIQP